MMDTTAQILLNAERAMKQAAEAQDEATKQEWLGIAQQWIDLAAARLTKLRSGDDERK